MRKSKGSRLDHADILSLAVDSVMKKKAERQDLESDKENALFNRGSTEVQGHVAKDLFNSSQHQQVSAQAPLRSTEDVHPEKRDFRSANLTATQVTSGKVLEEKRSNSSSDQIVASQDVPLEDDGAYYDEEANDFDDNTSFDGAENADNLKKSLIAHFLRVLNTASYDELLKLRGIGKVRAMRLLTERNAGYMYNDISELEDVGMNKKQIQKFLRDNAASIM